MTEVTADARWRSWGLGDSLGQVDKLKAPRPECQDLDLGVVLLMLAMADRGLTAED